jgi:hypothetical protein
MGYSRYIEDRVAKYRQFFSDGTPGQIMVNICPYTFEIDYSGVGLEHRPYSSWDYAAQYKEFMERKAAAVQYYLKYTQGLDNDYIPDISPNMGAGVCSAFLSGAPVIMGDDTSWVHPVVHDWADMEGLKPDPSNEWVGILRAMVRHSVDICDGSFVPGTFSHYGPGDLSNALRGNQIFYDVYDEPERVHALMDISAGATIWLERELRPIAGLVDGGTVTANMWFPGAAPYLSEDFSDLCSAATYREIGSRHTQRILDALGGAYIHHHGKGYHIHGEIAKLRGLKTLEISLDPNGPRPVEHLEELFELNHGIPLMIRCAAGDVYRHIGEMKRGRLVIMLNIGDLDEGREVMRFIRKHSRI